MPSPAVPDKLVDLLRQEVRLLRSFLALLRREQDMLTAGDTASLSELAASKGQTAIDLGQLATVRDGELVGRGLPPGCTGMEAWVLTAHGAASRADWRELLELAGDARALNDTNGKLINLHLQHNQQALNALMAAAGQAATYGPDGQQRSGGGSRSLGSA